MILAWNKATANLYRVKYTRGVTIKFVACIANGYHHYHTAASYTCTAREAAMAVLLAGRPS